MEKITYDKWNFKWRIVWLIVLFTGWISLQKGHAQYVTTIEFFANGSVKITGEKSPYGATEGKNGCVDLTDPSRRYIVKGTTTSRSLWLNGNKIDLYLQGANISGNRSPIDLGEGCKILNLTIDGNKDNYLTGASGWAAIQVLRGRGQTIEIKASENSTGMLWCSGGYGSAAIGGSGVNKKKEDGMDAGTIKIVSGKIRAYSKNGAAAIGGGAGLYDGQRGGMAEKIVISGGDVYAQAEGGGAAIGSGHGRAYRRTEISGGRIETLATSGGESGAGAGIGGGRWCSSEEFANEYITITGGTVLGGYIGHGMNSSVERDVKIYGGSVQSDIWKGRARNQAGNIVYKVQTDAQNLADNVWYKCSYTGSSSSFSATPSNGRFYFWMESGSGRTVTMDGYSNLVVPAVSSSSNNYAPLIFSNGTAKYYNLDALSNTGVSSLKLESSLPLYKNITITNDKTLDLNGKTLSVSGTNRLTLSGITLTLLSKSGGSLSADVQMTSKGLLKIDKTANKIINLGNVYNSNGTLCFLHEVTFPYGTLTNCVLKRADASYSWQYAVNSARYIWLPSGTNNLSLTTVDGTYFQDLVTAGTNYATTQLTDRTTSFDISKGAVNVKTNKEISYSVNNSSRTSKDLTNNIEITGTGTTNALTIEADRTVNFKNASAKSLKVSSGTLKLLGSATFQSVDLSGATAKLNLEGATALNVSSAAGFPVPSKSKILFSASSSLPTIKIGGKTVWFASIPLEKHGAISDIKQGTETLPGGYYTTSSTPPYCFWLNDSEVDLTFSAGSPLKYYYAGTHKMHDYTLSPSTYKTQIVDALSNTVRYKDLASSFKAAKDGQTIVLIDDMPNNTDETITLAEGNPAVAFDLASYVMNGVIRLNANGGRLTLRSSGNGSLASQTTLSGLVYTELPAASLGGTIMRNGKEVVRYMTDKLLAKDKVTYSWSDGSSSDEAMMSDGKACLWLPKGVGLGRVDLGYSTNMAADKCGEIPSAGTLSAHSANNVTVDPYLNIARSKVAIGAGGEGGLSMAYNGVERSGFALAQPITVYGTGTNPIEVTGAEVGHMTLRDLSIPLTASHGFPAISVRESGKLSLYLSGRNNVKGGSKSGGVSAGVSVGENATLAIHNDDSPDEQSSGTGQLTARGGAHIRDAAPGIGGDHGVVSGNIEIHGGTIHAEGGLADSYGIGNGLAGASDKKTVKILAGSVDAGREWSGAGSHPFVNKQNDPVYLMMVNTGLTPNKKYLCTYPGCDPEPFPVLTDGQGKCYFWMPERTQAQKPEATFRDPATNNTTTVQLVKVDKNDDNVAPIVAELVQPGRAVEYHNNLRDAFDAVRVSGATIRLLIDIDNLATVQTVRTGYKVTLDLDRYNLDTKNSREAGFVAETGAYLYVTGEGEGGTGNIKSTFKISGDIYIAGIVPLTDATPLQGDRAVFRTLISGLPDSPSNMYTYSYGSISNRTFYLHDGVACLWLPDASGELTFRVTQGNNVTDYTAGNITTNTQRTESMGCQAVGVIARVVRGDAVRDFNNLPDAFKAAVGGEGNKVLLLANVALTKPVTVSGEHDFTLDLNGMSLTAATGTALTVGPNRYLTITDTGAGTKGSVQMDLSLSGRLFVSGNVSVRGNVVASSGAVDAYLWRTMVDVSNLADVPSEVAMQGGNASIVSGQEACFWMPKAANRDFTFTAGGTSYPVKGVNINDNHQDNLITLGVGDEEARIAGKLRYKTFAEAWNAAADGDEIVLLKDATIASRLTLGADQNVRVDVARYSLAARGDAGIEVAEGAVLRVNSGNGNGRLLVPVVNKGVLFVGAGIQPDRLTGRVTDASGKDLWRALVSNLPDGMPDDGTYTFEFGVGEKSPQTGSFYVSSQIACLWLEDRKAQRLYFPQFASYTDNVTIDRTHANQVIWGQSNVAQVQNTMYVKLSEAFSKNTNQTVTLLKSAVLETSQEIASRMRLEMAGYSVSSTGSPATRFTVAPTGSLRIAGTGSVGTDFRIDHGQRVEGSNANLAVEAGVNMSGQVTDGSNTAYWRTTVALPADVYGELEYAYGSQTGKVTAVKGEPLTLWLTVPDNPLDIKLTRGQESWIATSVKITGTHVNPISVQYITDEARISGGAYYKTLAEALSAASNGLEILVERDLEGVSGGLGLSASLPSGQTVSLNLDGKRLTASGATFDAGSARLVIGNGYLDGELSVRGDIFAHPSLSMNGTQVSDAAGRPVWRTLVRLPKGTREKVSYTTSAGPGTKAAASAESESRTGELLEVEGTPYACLWLPASNEVRDYVFTTSDGKVYPVANVLIMSNHGNELDVTNNDPVVENTDKSMEYASLNTALAIAADGARLRLLKDVALSLTQAVSSDVTLDLNGHTLTSSNSGGFAPAEGKSLLISSGTGSGRMVGSFFLANDRVSVDPAVDIIGEVRLNRRPVWRVWVTGAGSGSCWWEESYELAYDREITVGDRAYEATLPAGLSSHDRKVRAYEVVEITTPDATASASELEDRNVVVRDGAGLRITGNFTLHRLTVEQDARVEVDGKVMAEAGIVYKRTFPDAVKWSAFSLPYTAAVVTTTPPDGGKPVALAPALKDGTGGHYWLGEMGTDGGFGHVSAPEIVANKGYLIAVPEGLARRTVSFVSAPNQWLSRPEVTPQRPQKGFAIFANGTLGERPVTEACYTWDYGEQNFRRQPDGASVMPFTCYVMADASYTAETMSLRIADIVGNETVEKGLAGGGLKVTTRPGCIVVEAAKPMRAWVYTLDGHLVLNRRLGAGTSLIHVRAGYYIVNREKVFVRP